MSAQVLFWLGSAATLPWFSYREGVLQAEVDRLAPWNSALALLKHGSNRSTHEPRRWIRPRSRSRLSLLPSVQALLLEQLRRITPEGVRLLSVTVQASELRISGEAEAAGAFEKINALDLNLETLAAVPTQGAQVLKATREADGLVTFSIKVGSIRRSNRHPSNSGTLVLMALHAVMPCCKTRIPL